MHEKELSDFAQKARALAAQISPGPIKHSVMYSFPKSVPDASELRGLADRLTAAADAIEAFLRR